MRDYLNMCVLETNNISCIKCGACNCVEIGSFNHSVKLPIPNYYSKEAKKNKQYIYIDKCILKEIQYLWSEEIKTMGCCCGHGKIPSSVAVLEESINKMIDLGYKKNLEFKEGHVFYLNYKKG